MSHRRRPMSCGLKRALIVVYGTLGVLIVLAILGGLTSPSTPHPASSTGITPKGCMVGTKGHSIVMVYTEDTSKTTSDCRGGGKGDYLYIRAPALTGLTHYCTATKTDGTAILDVYDKRNDLALPTHPEAGAVGNVVCALFQANKHWTVDRTSQ